MCRLWQRAQTFLRLPRGDRIAFVESITLFWFFSAALKVVPFRRFKHVLGRPGPKDDPASRDRGVPLQPEARRVARWMRRIGRRHPDTCLAQALAGRMMLRRRGLPSTVSFGVREDPEGEWFFHAWLVHDDRVLTGGGRLPEFAVLSTFYDDPRPAS